ncbi:MAG TPA: hypothetical protein VH302_12830 [Bryobacteraceae bacterium]|jgi:hypothetical protein|nr:hypothetical protein [Bryobacteraceae bacterium]
MTQRLLTCAIVAAALCLAAAPSFSSDDLKLLQDPAGWEYVTVSDQDDGIQTEHVCFDGQPHPGQCSGTLTMRDDKTFTQSVSIHGQSVARHGTYEVQADQISFFDEFGTRDGPYSAQLNADTKMLILSMASVRMELELASQYREDLGKKRAPKH